MNPILINRSLLKPALTIAALALATALIWRAFAGGVPTPAPAEHAKSDDGAFHPSREQWAAFKIEAVRAASFRSTVNTDGNIAFNEDTLTPVYSPYSGRVGRVYAKLGDVVARGAKLMAVDASEFVQGQSDLAAAKLAFDTARATEQRQHDLYDAGAAALKDWRQAQADLGTTRAAYNAARGRLRILGKSDTQIDQLEATPTGATESIVTAPIAGTVTQRQIGVGQYIGSAAAGNANAAFTVGDLSTVWLVANVRESDAPFLRLGQSAAVTVPALPGRSFPARITWIGAAIDPATHRLPVHAEVKNRDGLLKPMMFASFSIATSEAATAPAVPAKAIVYEGEKARVFVIAGEDSIVVRQVVTGRRQEGLIEIVDGLKAGERIVTAGTLFVDRAVAAD